GDLTERLSTLAEPLARRQRAAMRAQTEEDRRVVTDLVASGASILVLKGALLAQTVYPAPECRFRTDLDLLADPDQVPAVEGRLRCLGYYPPEGAQSAMPMRQSQWTRSVEGQVFSVDLHWDLRNHPALQGRFGFSELLASSQPLPGLCEEALGLGFPHAILNASMHYFNDYADERPQQWLLDKDLLWRAMTPEQRQQTTELACEKGLAGLLAESLSLARDEFGTPVDEAAISRLRQAGQHEWTTGLVKANRKRVTAYWFALRSEPGLSRKFKRIMTGLFPPSSYVRKLYPDGSRFGLVGLYVRRIAGSMKQSHR
ncbi:MAG: nucleotidyltransferase family protein, partial [Wenzhouxiangella sp.]|nr:nucleotidyltransferase family protein [Wenzhouxiangella sp.]